MNISNNLKNAASHFPDHTALIDENRTLTYSELDTESSRIASALRHIDLLPGDHVALLYPNACDWIAFYFGVLKAGAVTVTLPYAMTPKELDPVLDDCRPKMILTNDAKLTDFNRKKYTDCIISDNADMTYPDLLSKGTDESKIIEREPHDTAAILYTGGTTGMPKGVMLTHSNIISSSFNVARNERSSENDRALCFLPLNHVFAQVHIMNSAISTAGGLVLQPSFNMDAFLGAIPLHHVTKIYSVPTVYTRLLSLPDLKEKLCNVRYCFSAAASMAKELVLEWKNRTGLDIFEAYGMTESASMVTYNHYHKHVPGSVGTAANGVEIQIRDHSGNVLGKNQRGEICISGPNIMKGYLNRGEDTQKAFWGRWFRSGDVGIIDENDYLFIVDRIKDLIITGGENVAPREVEDVLYERPEIEECAVIGLPDEEYGERVTAYITARKGYKIDPVELKAFMKQRLSPFKVPKQFITIPALPKSSAGKLLKRKLKEQVLDGTIAGR
ncbi:MAG: AMP-binding protein [Desulfobacteraceae bacterium]|nr:MAG: AMP-binding protein [Desulfobacteraceae bacterium]